MITYSIFCNSSVNTINNWENKTLTWEKFVESLKKPKIQNYTFEYYKNLKKLASVKLKDVKDEKEREDVKKAKKEYSLIKDTGCFIPGKFEGTVRRDKYLIYRSMISIDVDNDPDIMDKLKNILFKCFWHTTHSHTFDNPRIRIFIPLEKVINTKEEYKVITEQICSEFGIIADIASYKANQVMFMPAIPENGEFKCGEINGDIINPYDYMLDEKTVKKIKKNRGSKEIAFLSKRDNVDVKELVRSIKSPWDMQTVIGQFCRKYTIPQCIDKYLNEVYEPGNQPGCYTLIEGSGMNGLKIYPDNYGNKEVFAYSFHSTDIANDGKCHNAFDLIKLHRFKGNLIEAIKFIKSELGIKDKFAFKTESGHEADYYSISEEGKRILNIPQLVNHLLTDDNHKTYNTNNGFYIYNDGVYEQKSKNQVCDLIQKHLVEQDITTHTVNDIYNQMCWKEYNVNIFNDFNNIISFNNTILKVKDDGEYEILQKSPDLLTTYKFNHNLNLNAHCEKWEKFLNDILPKDQQKIIQEVMGYLLIPDNSAKKFFTLYGIGDSGKSVILKTIIRILGDEMISAATLQRLGNPNLRFVTSELYGKLANVVGDLPAAPIQDTGVIKMLTGDDKISAERKGLFEFRFFNIARLVCSTNTLPPCYNDKSAEFYNRMVIIPFNKSIPKSKQINKLEQKFNIEGVINWCLEGLQRLLHNNLNFSTNEINEKLVEDYKRSNNNTSQFIADAIEPSNSSAIKSTTLYAVYKDYCLENGNSPLSRNKFINELDKVYERSNTCVIEGKKSRGYKNIKFSSDFLEEYNFKF